MEFDSSNFELLVVNFGDQICVNTINPYLEPGNM